MGRGKRSHGHAQAILPLSDGTRKRLVPKLVKGALATQSLETALDSSFDLGALPHSKATVIGPEGERLGEVSCDRRGRVEVQSLSRDRLGNAHLDDDGLMIQDYDHETVADVRVSDPSGRQALVVDHDEGHVGSLALAGDRSRCEVTSGDGERAGSVVSKEGELDVRVAGAGAYFLLLAPWSLVENS